MKSAAFILAAATFAGGAFAQGNDATCHHCGTVQSVQAVTRTTQPKGIAGTPVTPGMAIGGVVGGLVGNQVGHGNGRTLATVGGAAGGAYLGHSIEKKQYRAYVMHIRMDDGTMRTIEQRNALAKGSRVAIDEKTRTAHLQRAPRQG